MRELKNVIANISEHDKAQWHKAVDYAKTRAGAGSLLAMYLKYVLSALKLFEPLLCLVLLCLALYNCLLLSATAFVEVGSKICCVVFISNITIGSNFCLILKNINLFIFIF